LGQCGWYLFSIYSQTQMQKSPEKKTFNTMAFTGNSFFDLQCQLTNRCSRSQAPWDNNTWAQSLRSNFSPRVIAPKRGVSSLGEHEYIQCCFLGITVNCPNDYS